MKKKFSLGWRLVVVVALVASLGLVFAAPTGAVTAELDVDANCWVKDPGTGEISPCCGCLNKCDDFYINATVTAIGTTVSGVQATIEIVSGDASLDPAESPVKQLGQIAACIAQDVWWKLHCEGPGDVDITVTATGAGVDATSDTLMVEQCVECEVLYVAIIEPECEPTAIETCQVFGVKAQIWNDGMCCRDVSNVAATISIEGTGDNPGDAELVEGMPDHWNLGDMAEGSMHVVGWTLHCTSPGDVIVTVDADFDGELVGEVGADTRLIIQREPPCLDVEIISPDDGDEYCADCESDTVEVDICNYCDAGLENITATLVATGPGGVNITSLIVQPVPNLPAPSACTYYCEPISWDFDCTSPGEVTFTVTVVATNTATGKQIIDVASVTIDQVECLINLTVNPANLTVSTEQCFEVTAEVWNCTDAAIGTVDVTIDWSPVEAAHLALVDECPCDWCLDADIWPNDQTKTFSPLCKCCGCEAEWCLICDEPGPLEITVSTDDVGAGCSATVTIDQEEKAHLVGGLDTYYQCTPDDLMTPMDAFNTCQEFHVVVPVFNTGEACADNVEVKILVDGDATIVYGDNPQGIGTIPGGGSGKATWVVHCNAEGDVLISVIELSGNDCNSGCPIPQENICPPCPVEVKQIPVDIQWMQPSDCDSIEPCTYFTAKIKVINEDDDDTLYGVTATLVWDPTELVELVEGQPNPVPLEDLNPAEWAEATWELHCTDLGEVDFFVLVESADPEMCMFSEGPTVYQEVEPTCLEIDIISPDMGSFYATGQEFAVTAEIKNRGIQCVDCPVPFYASFEAWNVVAGLNDFGYDIAMGPHFFKDGLGHFTIVDCNFPEAAEDCDGMTLWDIGNIPAGESAMVTWTVRCDRSGLTAVVAEVDWDNMDVECVHPGIPMKPNGNPYNYFLTALQYKFDVHDFLLLWQYPTSHLEVEILTVMPDTTVNVCDEFIVTYKVKNTGEADASQVEAILSVTPEGTVRPAEGYDSGYTQYIGTIPGYGESEVLTWPLHCKEACESTINITAEGLDEYGWHKKQQCASTGNFFIEGGCLVAEGLLEQVGGPAQGWTYGVFVGDANGLTGPFSINTPVAWSGLGGGPTAGGKLVVQGYVIPHVGTFGGWAIEHLCGDCCNLLDILGDVEGEDLMMFVGYWIGDESMWTGEFVQEMCVSGGLLEVINGTITGGEVQYCSGGDCDAETPFTEVMSFLGGTYCSSMAAEAGLPIDPRFIEDAWVTVRQLPSAGVDLGIIKTVDDPNPEVGEDVTYTITVANYGPGQATGVVVEDTLFDTVLTYLDDDATQGTYDDSTGEWTVGNMTVGASASLMVTAEVQLLDEYTNEATVTCDQPDGNTLNDTDSATINPSLAIQLEDGWNFVSWPLIPDNADIEPEGTGVLKDLAVPNLTTNLESVWGNFDPVAGTWDMYAPGDPLSTLTEMWDGVGFWIDMKTAGLAIVIEGQEQPDPPDPPRVYEVIGGGVGGYWNVIGFKSTTAKSPDVYLEGIAGQYTIIYGFDEGAYFIVGTPGHPNLEPGLAYWIAVLESGNIFP